METFDKTLKMISFIKLFTYIYKLNTKAACYTGFFRYSNINLFIIIIIIKIIIILSYKFNYF